MVKTCCVKGCQSSWQPNGSISYFSFPFNNEELLGQWISTVSSKGKISKYSKVCSKHFLESDFEKVRTFMRLKKSAVPSLFVTFQENDQLSNHGIGSVDVDTSKEVNENPPAVLADLNAMEIDDNQFIASVIDNSNLETNILRCKRKCDTNTDVEFKLRRKVRILQGRIRRLQAKSHKTEDIIKTLKREGKCNDQLEHELLRRFSGFSVDILTNELKNAGSSKSRKRYTEKIKDFASTIYFYSPKAYKFIRSKLNLPHEASLRKMIGGQTCEAGFVNGVFEFLNHEKTNSSFVTDVGLILDGMSIRSQLIVDQKNNSLRGNVDYGTAADELNIEFDKSELATEMLAFQIVSYSKKFKIPIAHFFVKRVNAEIQSKLINEAIKKLYNVGIIVRSITCDGTSTNLKTLEKLGCSFEFDNFKVPQTFFKHPFNNSNIYAIMDPCHMLKLCRNTFAEKNLDSPDGEISFRFVKNLNDLQEAEGFKFANKLSNNHINYKNKKMKVCLAAQTISSGVADAIDYLRESGSPEFRNSEATCKFIRMFDMLFDMLNSRSAYGKGFKSPLSKNNIDIWINNFDKCAEYIRTLKLDNKLVVHSNRKVFALGFLINIYSFRLLALDLLEKIAQPLKYFLTYKCSQDHIELYFCCIRSRGGWNNNPNVLQALWSIRRLLYRNSVTPSFNANCSLDSDNAIPIYEFRFSNRNVIDTNNTDDDNSELDELMTQIQSVELSCYQENILYYITGYIINQFMKHSTCSHCNDLVTATITDHNYSAPDVNKYSGFLTFINRGKLCIPSNVAFDIVKCCEKSFKSELNIGFNGSRNFKERITAVAVAQFVPKISIAFHPQHPVTETIDGFSERHEMKMIKFIAAKYSKLRLHAYSKTKTLEYIGEKSSMRQKFTKLILFNNV